MAPDSDTCCWCSCGTRARRNTNNSRKRSQFMVRHLTTRGQPTRKKMLKCYLFLCFSCTFNPFTDQVFCYEYIFQHSSFGTPVPRLPEFRCPSDGRAGSIRTCHNYNTDATCAGCGPAGNRHYHTRNQPCTNSSPEPCSWRTGTPLRYTCWRTVK